MRAAKILTIFGTRPEAIKMAPVVTTLRQESRLDVRVCVTAQHRDLLDQVLSLFAIQPDHDLNIMAVDQDLVGLTTRMLTALGPVLAAERPDLLLVHGDTTTCFVASLGCFYAGIPVGHVEAGLRTHNLAAPFPEEANRALTGRLARYHFAPTARARQNLLAENIPDSAIWVTGNTGIDALFQVREMARLLPRARLEASVGADLARRLDADGTRLILVTGHRRENFGRGIDNMCDALAMLAIRHHDWQFVYPVHLNPNVHNPVTAALGDLDNVHLLEPLDYLSFVWLMDRCDIVLTDSGGIQEEAPSLGKPVLVMRAVTERPEAVDAGTVKLVGTDRDAMIEGVEELLSNRAAYDRMARAINPYGDGLAAQRIARILKTELGLDHDDEPPVNPPGEMPEATAVALDP